MTLPLPVLDAADMRAAEQAAAEAGTPLATLMDNAGAALGQLAQRMAAGRPVRILCGPGNNGGDGYVAARWLDARGVDVEVVALAQPASELCRAAAAVCLCGLRGRDAPPLAGAMLVDAVFGTGLSRPLDAELARLIAAHADAAARILAADVPSGVASDGGGTLNCPVTADVTLAFAALKPAHLLHPAASHCGIVRVADIGIPSPLLASETTVAVMPELALPDHGAHKYSRGLVAVVAGAMPGAAELAARGAARAGAGYVRLIGSSLPPTAPHAIVRQGWRDGAPLTDARIGAVVIGPGLGEGAIAEKKFAAALATGRSLVIDADALSLIGASQLPPNCILTPHAGEFDRLADGNGGSKLERTRALAARLGAVVIHKGADSVIAAPDGRVAIGSPGSAWLATAGTGDVLAGIAGAMLARGLSAFEAAQAAVLLHHRAALRAGPGLIADDLVAAPVWP
jgi:ADP-dependent NAD(P)H-hydrate dehydratase / NAD(P)H-hydrate epimerase